MRILFFRLKAGSLVATLILSLVLLITASLLLLSVYYFKYFKTKEDIGVRLQDDIFSAQEFILSDTLISKEVFADSINLFKGQPDSLYYTQELWGCIPLAGMKVAYKGRSKSVAMFYGASAHPYRDACLYVTDYNRPLSVSGDTYIEGKAYLPKSGLRSGFFGQQGFSRKNLIEGEIATSGKTLPPLNPALLEKIKYFESLITDTLQKFERLPEDSLYNPFFFPARVIKLNKLALIGSRNISGKFILVSDSIIEVSPSSRIADVVLVAPYIRIRQGFKGAVQAFALDSVTVDAQCHLYYPSVIAGIGRNSVSGSVGASINLKENAVVEGLVLGMMPEQTSNIKPVVKVKKNAVVKGMVYNTGFTYLSGKVEGSVFTDFFFEQRGPMSMENILIDATIVQSKWFTMGNHFSIFTQADRPKVIKWLSQN